MAEVERISVQEARRKAQANQALLVCAYADAKKTKTLKLAVHRGLGVSKKAQPSLCKRPW